MNVCFPLVLFSTYPRCAFSTHVDVIATHQTFVTNSKVPIKMNMMFAHVGSLFHFVDDSDLKLNDW